MSEILQGTLLVGLITLLVALHHVLKKHGMCAVCAIRKDEEPGNQKEEAP